MTARSVMTSLLEGMWLALVLTLAENGHHWPAFGAGIVLCMMLYVDGKIMSKWIIMWRRALPETGTWLISGSTAEHIGAAHEEAPPADNSNTKQGSHQCSMR